MSAHKFTPRPWSVVDGHYSGFIEIKGLSFRLPIVVRATDLDLSDYMARCADAHLISAAPDLLSAHDLGEKVISAFVAMTADGRLDCRNPAVIELCEALSAYQKARDAAIAKATGDAK